MVYSMTGFGRASTVWEGKTLQVEIRSLNSKQGELRLRMPGAYRDKEAEIRKQITEAADRGKIDFNLNVESPFESAPNLINESLFISYTNQLKSLIHRTGLQDQSLLSSVLRLPNVVGTEDSTLEEAEWTEFQKIFQEALQQFTQFRLTEGKSIDQDLRLRISSILTLLEQVGPFEKERMERQRLKLQNLLIEQVGAGKIDNNRFEQELIFYLEKMDITEEKVRLAQHCEYFMETMNQPGMAKGRTLNFIGQEIGREINTLGAKANDSSMQRCVVQMKDELEKIKEQLANIV
ncbi:MAG: YicC/YloC family endoribonuclease [Saprospiraceae bacterium]